MAKNNSKQYTIEGTITDQQQQPVPNALIEAFDWDPNTPENPLGSPAYTNEDGYYHITYRDEDFRLGGKEKGGADIVIYVYGQNGQQIGKSDIKYDASTNERIDLSVEFNDDSENTPLGQLMDQFINDDESLTIDVGGAQLNIDKHPKALNKLVQGLHQRGIFSKEGLVETALNDFNIDEEAEKLGVSSLALAGFIEYSMSTIPKEQFDTLKEEVKIPKATGGLDLDDPEYELIRKELKLDEIPIAEIKDIRNWRKIPEIFHVYFGPIAAVDLRPYLGDARNQNPRGTCTAFSSTAIVEAMEYFRDPRNKHLDLSEELIFWYSKHGQLYSAGGYSGIAALRHYAEFGGCEEIYLPYDKKSIGSNHAHVPVPDVAIDRAQFYKNGEVVRLATRDVDAVKETLRTGRCVGISTGTHGWNSCSGQVNMPEPLDSKGPEGGHAVTIVGFIDHNDLHDDLEGGFFIVRNSWGCANSTSHLFGPEYGGHLLMPYGWYRRYTSGACTMKDIDGKDDEERNWLVEYYDNRDLQGKALETVKVRILSLLTQSIPVPREIDELNFDWGSGSALRFEYPAIIDINSLPLKDNFSIRFTKLKRFREGYYKFRLTGDDGIRLYVDDQLIINSWKVQSATTYSVEHYLTGGDHIIKVEYYERTGRAKVALEIEAINFNYQLYSNTTLAGNAAHTFTDSRTQLEWRHVPPIINNAAPGTYSLRGRSSVHFKGGSYRFHALHNGGCRMWVGSQLVLDDWNGTNGNGSSVNISDGVHALRVEYKHTGRMPAVGSKSYYKSHLHFGWSEEFWMIDFHHDQERWTLREAGFPNPDSHYQAFRTLSLTGTRELRHKYQDTTSSPWSLDFSSIDNKLLKTIPAAEEMSSDVLSLLIQRRIFIDEDGYYNANLKSDDGYRMCVSGKQLLEDHHITGSDPQNQDIWLKAGFHDVSIEYANSKWGGTLVSKIEKVQWKVDYYDGINFDNLVETKQLNAISEVISSLPAGMDESTFSVRVTRGMWLPLGRYRFQLKGDDGVRLKINGISIIDGWTVQSPTSYQTYYEHHGGAIKLEIEYFQNYGGKYFDFQMVPEGFFGEYYRGVTLNKTDEGAALDRNVPIAYRFEPVIDFDWGAGNRLDRVGSNNFSARWQGKVSLPVGRYRIDLTADDGVRLFVDGRMVIDDWHTQNAHTHTKKIDLVGRLHDIKLEYFEKSGSAVCKLEFFREF